jgi:hypothetical protein
MQARPLTEHGDARGCCYLGAIAVPGAVDLAVISHIAEQKGCPAHAVVPGLL